jgi:hypothetical protein
MTVFDRLEAQLLDAHPHRARRPLPAPRRVLAMAAAAAAVAAIVVAALSAGPSNPATPAAQPGHAVPAVVRSQTTVSVLNATRKPYAAGRAAKELAGRGWRIGKVSNAPGPPGKSSCVDFTPGNSQAATMVAKDLGILNVVPPNSDYVRAAGPGADVIVVIGADLAG